MDCETSCPIIFDNYLKPETIAMFEAIDVMRQKELEARNEVKWETYTKKISLYPSIKEGSMSEGLYRILPTI